MTSIDQRRSELQAECSKNRRSASFALCLPEEDRDTVNTMGNLRVRVNTSTMMNRRHLMHLCLVQLFYPAVGAAYLMPTSRWPKRVNASLRARRIARADAIATVGQTDRSLIYRFHWINEPRLTVLRDKGVLARWSQSMGTSGDARYLPPTQALTALAHIFSSNTIQPWLEQYGVSTAKQRLALADEQVCMVIGTDRPNLRIPQVWIDQETFLPRRFIFKSDNRMITLELQNWHGPVTNGRFPYLFKVRIGRRPVYTFTTSKVYSAAESKASP